MASEKLAASTILRRSGYVTYAVREHCRSGNS